MVRTASFAERTRRRNAALLSGCALALALAATPQSVRAQDADKGFQGSHTVNAGSAEVFTGGTGSKFTQIDVNAPQTVVTWTPDDTSASGTINFLPDGHTAAFTSSSLGDYTVLNRILPGGSATIGINGNITSSVSNGEGQSAGGNVWFYTPNGFVIGKTATIQVGGLVMTTNDITYSVDPQSLNANFYDAKGAINFRGPDGSKASIINSGSLGSGSYLALIAPRVVQSGTVSAPGPIGYVAAEQVDLKINAGNFDIVVGQGTTDANGIVHNGVTSGDASSGLGFKSMQFVAVPKNTALTMLLSGQIGYIPATEGFSDGTAIVLTAGADGSPDGNIEIGEAYFRNQLSADATGDITVAPPSPGLGSEGLGLTIFEGYTTLSGDKSVHLTSAAQTAIWAFNGLNLYSDSAAGGGAITVEALAGGAFAPAGQIDITNGFGIYAYHYGDTSDDGTIGFDSRGGTITIAADGGQINADYMYASAAGYGGFGSKAGGDGFGGTIDVRAGFGGAINTSYLSLEARGDGGASYDFSQEFGVGGQGGVGHGGAITVADSSGPVEGDPIGGLLGFGSAYLDVSSVGGNSLNSASGLGGDAFGGTIDFTVDRQNQSMSYIDAYARATDGDSGSQDPLGGTITMTVGGGAVFNLGSLYLDAGIEASINSVPAAFGHGGTIDLTVVDGASLLVDGYANLRASADVSSDYYTAASSSPDLTGGTIVLTADNGNFTANNLYLDASAYNVGADASAGFAHGGVVNIIASNGGSIQTEAQFNDCTECSGGGFFQVNAEGYGTGGTSANIVFGGDITLAANSGGTIFAASGTLDLYAGAENGISQSGQANGVIAQGGTIAIDAIGGTIATGISADVSGYGGDAENRGGSGTGGTIDVRVLGGTLTDYLYADASGHGGFTYIEGDGGDGAGGRFTLTSDADATFANFGLEFEGNGQGGSTYLGTGGDGAGGSAQVDVLGGTHSWYEVYLSGYGQGASSYGAGSLAGSGYGSIDGLNFHLGGGATFSTSYFVLDSQGTAGADGNGNVAIGGKASLLVDALASLTADSIGINASGSLAFEDRNPDSFNTTPNARGGTASATVDTGTITTPFLEVVANGMTGGALTSAGTSIGGTATVGASDGGLIDIIDGFQVEVLSVAAFNRFSGLVIEAKGLGAEGPSAAHANGGTATLYTEGGAISSVSGIVVDAGAEAGDFFANQFVYSGPANGFDATGGTASVEMRTGGSGGGAINAPSLSVVADGYSADIAPVQGAGGIGTGGSATLNVAQGALNTGDIFVTATGYGGSAADNSDGSAFASGSGHGGTATFDISGGSVSTTSLGLYAQGIGGAGQGENEGATTSLAGTGTGGTARLVASGGTLTVGDGVSVQAVGFGGQGGFNPNFAPGGDGADAFGGSASFETPAGGNAALDISGDIRVDGSAFGGEAGFSYAEVQGNGGNATGGSAAMNLADVPFTFGAVQLYAFGAPGSGTIGGGAIGGSASFSLVDSTSMVAAPRTIENLSLNGASYAGPGLSVGGSTAFTAQVGNAASALTIVNDLSLYAYGESGPAGYGFTGAISGAPVTVGGAIDLTTPRDAILTITGAGALNAGGDIDISIGRTFTSSGAISAQGNAYVSAGQGISMTDLAAGENTYLQSFGPVVVSHDLRSGGPVTVSGSSVALVSLGGLTFADADATDGDLSIETEDDLLLSTVDATGAVTLTSNAGSIHNTGAVNGVGITYVAAGDVVSDTTLSSGGALTVDAGGTFSAPGTVAAVGDVSLSADLGMALAGVVSGGTTLLQATGGSVVVDSLVSPGPVTALAQSIDISAPGALTFTSVQATAGDLDLATFGNLTVGQGGASGKVNLTSTSGAIAGQGPIVAGGDVVVSANGGIALGSLTSGGTTSLTSASDSVGVMNLNSAGLVTARGTAINIGSSGALEFADLDATAGTIAVQTVGNLTISTVDATGSVTLTTSGGALNANGAINGDGITLSSLADMHLASGVATTGAIDLTSTGGAVSSNGPLSAGATLAVSGDSGVTLGNASSGGATTLTATNGAINVGNLSSAGAVSASGRSVGISSSGALSFANAVATAGDLALQTAGDLSVSQGSATGGVTLISTGGAVASTGVITSGGNSTVSGLTGVSLATLTSGGATSLTSANGTVGVVNLNSTGSVIATARSVAIGSTGALSFADLDATAGNVAVETAGNLTVATLDATGSVTLTSSGGAVSATGTVNAGGNVLSSGQGGVAFGTLASGGTTGLTAVNGAVTVAALTSAGAVSVSGRSVDLTSPGSLTVTSAQATAGALNLQTAQNLTVGTAAASGAGSLSAGGNLSTSGAVNAAGLTLSGANVTANGTLMSSADLSLSANQLLTIGALAAGSAVSITAGDITVGQTGRIGQRGLTQSIAITNRSASRPLYIGGTGQQGEFSLDKNEVARLFADDSITFTARSSEGTSGAVFVGDLALGFGDTANIGAGGQLKVDAAGTVEINGAIALTTVSDDDRFSIDPSRIDVVAGAGSIVMRNAAGALQGQLDLQAGTIAVADKATIATINGLSDFAAISAALDSPGPVGPEGGYLQAGTINLFADDAIFIQNGGATTEFDDRRGFLANALNIQTESNNPFIAINGVISTQSGSLVGLQTASAVSVNGGSAANLPLGANVTINGCNAGVACGVPEVTFDFSAPTSDELELVITTAEDGKGGQAGQLVQIESNRPLITPPIVDEPITGVGNDDLWQVKCVPEGDNSACPTEGGTE